jgi:hypothetical protein
MNNDLGVVKMTETDRTVELELPADEVDINLDYEAALHSLISPVHTQQKVKIHEHLFLYIHHFTYHGGFFLL